MRDRLRDSPNKHLRGQATALERLIDLAETLGFDVVFSRTKEMKDYKPKLEGLMCPDINRIYVAPNRHATETLAHEIGHVLLEHLRISADDSEFGENLADTMGWAMCQWVGVPADELQIGVMEQLLKIK